MGVGVQRHAPAALPPEKRPVTHCIGGWLGSRVGLDAVWKISPPPGFDHRTVQPVAQSLCRLSYRGLTFRTDKKLFSQLFLSLVSLPPSPSLISYFRLFMKFIDRLGELTIFRPFLLSPVFPCLLYSFFTLCY